jgi:DNA-binding SARP family transcriptional activator/TolB-like protein/Tfp pilus assembly protein PilF
VESRRPGPVGDAALELRLLGPMTVSSGGAPLALPDSRKVRALLAYLAMAPHPIARGRLCDLLWDVPNDPRAELRWCLSKIRRVLDSPGHRRVAAEGDTIRLDLAGCRVDARAVAEACEAGLATLDAERLRALLALFAGDFLDGLELDRSPEFEGWVTAQRRHFRGCQTALLEQLAERVPDAEALDHLGAWLRLAPFEPRAHEALLGRLARQGRLREGDEHVAAAVRQLEAEGLDPAPIRELWRAARSRAEPLVQVRLPQPAIEPPADGILEARRASIAVMPFADLAGGAGQPGSAADGLVHDIITRLAKLRILFVIAQGTVFALRDRRVAPEEAGRLLNVDYVVSGSLQRQGSRLTVAVELAETRSARIVWAEVFDRTVDDTFLVLDEIGHSIVAAIAHEIETIERNRAILRPPSSLDAWQAHHRGLWHMYRFSREDNEQARHFFATAVRLDPTFARAHAGLSFTHFQNVFQGWTPRHPEIERAIEAAGQSLMIDDRDPAAHWAMGRALWLRGDLDQSILELERAVDLSPNFALGHYALAFVHSQDGDPRAAISASDQSRRLSPFDPMLFAMLGARAMALVRLKRFDEAADWAVQAAARPNAHALIHGIAAYSLALAGRADEARAQLAEIRRTRPGFNVEDFLASFHFPPDAAALFRKAAARLGEG